MKLKMKCGHCGSSDVLKDAFVEWDYEAQIWVVHNVFDKGSYCQTCDGECTIEDEEISE